MTLRQLSCAAVLVLVACGPSGTGTGGAGGGSAGGSGGGTAGGSGGGTAGGSGGGTAGGSGGGTAGGSGGAGGGTAGGAGGAGGGTAGGSGGGGGSAGGTGGAAGGPSNITGTKIELRYTNDGGIEPTPVNLSNAVVAAYTPNGTGGYIATQGVGTAAGAFSIAAVPAMPTYLLRVGSTLVLTNALFVELGSQVPGRRSAEHADAGTRLSLSMTNLAPWTANDDLQVSSWNAPVDYFSTASFFGPFAANAPNVDDTSLSNAELGFSAHNLVKQSLGDDLTLFQLSGRRDAGYLIQEAKRGFSPTLINMQHGATTPVIGTFTTLPQSSATIDFRYGDFTAMQSAVNGKAVVVGGGIGLDVSFGPVLRNYASGYPDLVTVQLTPAIGNVVTSVSYGNPFPPTWGRFLYASATFAVDYAIALPDAGTTTPSKHYVAASSAQATSGTGSIGPITVVQSPLRFFKVDGVDATSAALTNVSTTPTITWTQPAIGLPTSVTLNFGRLTATPTNGTTRTLLFSITVPGNVTSIQVPPGLLVGNADYFILATAEAAAAPFNPGKPFQGAGYPTSFAQSLSGVLHTQ